MSIDSTSSLISLCSGGRAKFRDNIHTLLGKIETYRTLLVRDEGPNTDTFLDRLLSVTPIAEALYVDFSRTCPDSADSGVRVNRATVARHEASETNEGKAFVSKEDERYMYSHEFIFLILARAIFAIHPVANPPHVDLRTFLRRDAFGTFLRDTTDAEIRLAVASPVLELTTSKDVFTTEHFETLSLTERFAFLVSFFRRNTPIHSRTFVPRLCTDEHIATLTRELKEYQMTTYDLEYPERLRNESIASECLCGEYAEFMRVSPHDAVVYGPNTVIARSMLPDEYVKKVRESTSHYRSNTQIHKDLEKYADCIAVESYSSMFSTLAPIPPPPAGTRTAGRAGVANRTFEFRDSYFFSWYGWGTEAQHVRYMRRFREGRPVLPIILELGKGVFLVRCGPPPKEVATNLRTLGVLTKGDMGTGEQHTEWVECSSAMEALAEWEVRASLMYDGYMERPCQLPSIARPP